MKKILFAFALCAPLALAACDDSDTVCDQATKVLKDCAEMTPGIDIEGGGGGSCSGQGKTLAECTVNAADCTAAFACIGL